MEVEALKSGLPYMYKLNRCLRKQELRGNSSHNSLRFTTLQPLGMSTSCSLNGEILRTFSKKFRISLNYVNIAGKSDDWQISTKEVVTAFKDNVTDYLTTWTAMTFDRFKGAKMSGVIDQTYSVAMYSSKHATSSSMMSFADSMNIEVWIGMILSPIILTTLILLLNKVNKGLVKSNIMNPVEFEFSYTLWNTTRLLFNQDGVFNKSLRPYIFGWFLGVTVFIGALSGCVLASLLEKPFNAIEDFKQLAQRLNKVEVVTTDIMTKEELIGLGGEYAKVGNKTIVIQRKEAYTEHHYREAMNGKRVEVTSTYDVDRLKFLAPDYDIYYSDDIKAPVYEVRLMRQDYVHAKRMTDLIQRMLENGIVHRFYDGINVLVTLHGARLSNAPNI